MDLTNRRDLIQYLKDNGLWAKKSLGQIFLVDRGVLRRIIEAAGLKKSDTVLEIGPGSGILTAELIKKVNKVIAVELDRKMAQLLNCYIVKLLSDNNKAIQQYDNKMKIINADILKTDLNKIIESKQYKVVANIPYNITSKILEMFLTAENKPELIVLLVQKEVAERICAKPGEMSTLSVAVQIYGEPKIIGIVKASSFFPAPKVDSAILKINLKPQTLQQTQGRLSNLKNMEEDLFEVVRAGFHARRKTLINNLMVGTNLDKKTLSDILKKMGLSEKVRAQELSVGQWVKLTKELKN